MVWYFRASPRHVWANVGPDRLRRSQSPPALFALNPPPLSNRDESVVSVTDERKDALENWLSAQASFGSARLETASEDASFRRYFRLSEGGRSWIVMDAPPDLEPCEPFVRIGERMLETGANVPKIIARDLEQGFLVLSDFGDVHYQDVLDGPDREELYDLAITEILKFQDGLADFADSLPEFDRAWQGKELGIFREWCLPGIDQAHYEQAVAPLVSPSEAIPNSFGRRDFHVDNDEDWIEEEVSSFQQALEQGSSSMPEMSDEDFLRWFDLTGLQRHLKCIGIFHRLKVRDGKDAYLADVPRVRGYVETVLERYPELSAIADLYGQAELLA